MHSVLFFRSSFLIHFFLSVLLIFAPVVILRLMSRLSRQVFGMSRLSRPKLGIVQTFANKTDRLTFGMSRLARLRFAISRLSRPKSHREFRDQGGYGATLRLRKRSDQRDQNQLFPDFPERHDFPERRDFPEQYGDCATKKRSFRAFVTKVDTARLRKWCILKKKGATGLSSATENCNFKTFPTEVETAPFSRPRQRLSD